MKNYEVLGKIAERKIEAQKKLDKGCDDYNRGVYDSCDYTLNMKDDESFNSWVEHEKRWKVVKSMMEKNKLAISYLTSDDEERARVVRKYLKIDMVPTSVGYATGCYDTYSWILELSKEINTKEEKLIEKLRELEVTKGEIDIIKVDEGWKLVAGFKPNPIFLTLEGLEKYINIWEDEIVKREE